MRVSFWPSPSEWRIGSGTMPSADFCLTPSCFRKIGPAFRASPTHGYVGQISPDKNVNFPCTGSAFTFLPGRRRFRVAWHTHLGRPALYAVSVRSPAILHSGFLPTVRHLPAVAFASYFVDRSYPLGMSVSLRLPVSYRGLAPHKFTPMLGVHRDRGQPCG